MSDYRDEHLEKVLDLCDAAIGYSRMSTKRREEMAAYRRSLRTLCEAAVEYAAAAEGCGVAPSTDQADAPEEGSDG